MKRSILIIFLITISFSILGMVNQQPGIKFSHKSHIEDVGADCAACHNVTESQAATDNLMPNHDNCYACHDQNDTECGYCHVNADDPTGVSYVTTYITKFSHALHLGHAQATCAACHAGVEKSETVTEVFLPSMQQCQTCHSDLEAANYCQVCHAPSEQLKPADHKLDWNTAHGLISQLNEENCASCHTEKQCMDCHQGDNLDRKVHPLNFVNNHAVQAKIKGDNCYTCHEEQETCITCHREQLVMPKNHSTAGWSNRSNGGRHARQAKMDMDNCLACHSNNLGEPVCAQCHGK